MPMDGRTCIPGCIYLMQKKECDSSLYSTVDRYPMYYGINQRILPSELTYCNQALSCHQQTSPSIHFTSRNRQAHHTHHSYKWNHHQGSETRKVTQILRWAFSPLFQWFGRQYTDELEAASAAIWSHESSGHISNCCIPAFHHHQGSETRKVIQILRWAFSPLF